MGLRVATGVIGGAVVVGAIWLGAPWLTLLALVAGGLAVGEVYRLTPPGVGRMPVFLGVAAALGLLLTAVAAGRQDFLLASGIGLAAWAFVALLWFVACYSGGLATAGVTDGLEADGDAGGLDGCGESLSVSPEPVEGRPVAAFLLLALGPVYAGFLLGHGPVLRDLDGGAGDLGRAWLLFTLLVVFACDTGAFAVGRLVGRRRMAPRISPNKTWEGAVGGLVAAVGAGLAVGAVFDLGVPLWQQAAGGAAAGVAAQAGDLAESALKRAANVKDSGSIMPGHGGILDRMDSILFALPAVYYLLTAGFQL